MNLLAALLFLFGLSFSALGASGAYEARRKRAWPTAKGTVVAGEIIEIGGAPDDGRSPVDRPHFTGVVRYVYAFEPVTAYRGGAHEMEGKLESATSTSREVAEEHLRRYPVGERIDVRYDPRRPARSTLGPVSTDARFAAWMAVLGLAIAAISGVIALAG